MQPSRLGPKPGRHRGTKRNVQPHEASAKYEKLWFSVFLFPSVLSELAQRTARFGVEPSPPFGESSGCVALDFCSRLRACPFIVEGRSLPAGGGGGRVGGLAGGGRCGGTLDTFGTFSETALLFAFNRLGQFYRKEQDA